MKTLLLLLFTYLLSTNLFAEDSCKPVDLRNKQVKKMPIVTQVFGTCYSYAAAQMIDAYRFGNGDTDYDHQTFPLAPAFHSKNKWYFDLYQNFTNKPLTDAISGGWICPVVNKLIEKGSCNYNEIIKSIQGVETPGYEGAIVDKDFLYLGYFQKMEKLFNLLDRENELAQQAPIDILTECPKNRKEKRWFKRRFGTSYEKLIEILRKTAKSDSIFEFSGNFLYEQCKQHNKELNKDIECVSSASIRSEHILKNNLDNSNIPSKVEILDKVLNSQNPRVVGIRYCAKLLDKGPGFDGVNLVGFGKVSGEERCGNHASIVIGRRKKNGNCQYLIRNSYGERCGYHSSWECEKGEIWVNKKDLEKNLMDVSYIRKK